MFRGKPKRHLNQRHTAYLRDANCQNYNVATGFSERTGVESAVGFVRAIKEFRCGCITGTGPTTHRLPSWKEDSSFGVKSPSGSRGHLSTGPLSTTQTVSTRKKRSTDTQLLNSSVESLKNWLRIGGDGDQGKEKIVEGS